ncbi:hypothetical protein JET18_05365 [Chryseobacterium sp. L7]|uniref:YCII-related domain-containing protein n=1 Tax=Chryseobacterium endalhagicum TaxID=2797638 RepID=A0ABS1QCB1_9FLAO|nr:hypothetical protein [Chryseobacterium endalhagicum]MBL1220255.1 hypothetical protein [Chryseobacterium endalhagicum]
MKKYLLLYRAANDAMEHPTEKTPQEQKEINDSWIAWVRKCGSQLTDPGQIFGRAFNITLDGFEPVNSQIIGFSILQARDLEEAEELLHGNPHLGINKNHSFILYEPRS